MKYMFWVCMLVFVLVLDLNGTWAEEGFYVIPVTKKHYAPVEKTGQTISYDNFDDGDLKKGVTWPDPRFNDNGNGTVTDNLTGLIWVKDADCFGSRNWATALSDCANLAQGYCGILDGSQAGSWRLPNAKELMSLVDYGNYQPVLPNGHPFIDVRSAYWSSTSHAYGGSDAFYLEIIFGHLVSVSKNSTACYVWPVRGGQE